MARASRLFPFLLGGFILAGLIVGGTVLIVLLRRGRDADTLRLNCGGPLLKRNIVADNSTFYSHTIGRVQSQKVTGWRSNLYASNSYVPSGNDLVYTFTVRPGARVEVIAKFVELWEGAQKPSTRLLRVLVNGVIIADNLDLYRLVGGLGKSYTATRRFTANDGAVEVRVRPLKQNAIIAGIDVVAPGGVIAGGPLAVVTDANGTVTNQTTNSNSTNETTTNVTNPISNVTENPKSPSSSSPPTTIQPPPSTPTEPAPTAPKLVGSGQWRTVALKAGSPPPAKRHEACAVMNNNLVYLIGGRGNRPVSVYDPKTRTWTNKKQPPVELNHMQCVSIGTDIYVVGAWFGGFPRENAHKSTYVYNTITDTWGTKPGMPAARNRGGGAAVVYNGNIYVAMGNQGGHGEHATSLGYLDMYDPKTEKWTALATAPDPRDHVGGAIVDGRLCVAGGRDGGAANFWGSPITTVNCYNFATDEWKRGATLPDGRAGAATGATCGGLLMVAGGEGREAGAFTGGKAYDRVDLYDAKSDRFVGNGKLIRARHGSGLAVADCRCGNIYLPSGSGGLGGGPELLDIEVWSPDGVARDC